MEDKTGLKPNIFREYQSAINQIDDFFEYRYRANSVEQVKEFVMGTINQLTKNLRTPPPSNSGKCKSCKGTKKVMIPHPDLKNTVVEDACPDCGEQVKAGGREEALRKYLGKMDCGANSCLFAKERTGQRTNGACSCLRGLATPIRILLEKIFLQPPENMAGIDKREGDKAEFSPEIFPVTKGLTDLAKKEKSK